MAEAAGRFEWVGRLGRLWLIIVIVLLAFALAAAVAFTVMQASVSEDWMELLLPVLGVVGALVSLPAAFLVYGLVRVVVANEDAVATAAGRLARAETILAEQNQTLRRLADLATLSDRAKSLVFRDREIEAIREIVHEDMMRQDYETAEAVIESLERQLGYMGEAAKLRESLQASRKGTVEEKINSMVTRVQECVDARDWVRATRGAQQLARAFPDNAKVGQLPERIEAARTRHKRALLQEYGEAVSREDIDHSIELLKELDSYLTPQEAAALAESARGVFKAKLHSLGVQFAIKVTDQAWTGAVEVGEEIMRDYPNTRMAQEVKEKMDLLKARVKSGTPPAQG